MNLMTIEEVQHCDSNGDIIWQANNLTNTFHIQGQEFFTKVLFGGLAIPGSYFIGLDNRTTINLGDILASITGEPSSNGYSRKSINSQSGCTIAYDNPTWRVSTGNIIFNATGGSWGPVKNAFLMTNGYLISSVLLPKITTLTSGQYFSFRMRFSLFGD